MVRRRQKPKISGSDPEYDHKFERFRAVETDMPPDVKIPGVKPQQPQSAIDAKDHTRKKVEKAEPKSVSQTKSASPRSTARKVGTPVEPTQVVVTTPSTVEERQITLDAAVRVDQGQAMAPLVSNGLKQRDIVTLAGRRATEKFVISEIFLPKAEADRLPMKDGYHTSKKLSAKILDALRTANDPLGVSSDPAMVRGQFEALFWKCLDEVIQELSEKYLHD